jgi:hypothetical protein
MTTSDHVAARFDNPFDTSNLVSARSVASNRSLDLHSFHSFVISTMQSLKSFVSERPNSTAYHPAARSETYFEHLKPTFGALGDMV